MAHNLNFNERTGQWSFFSVQESAWHGLGQIVTEYPNSKDALQFAGLGYTVDKRPLFTYTDRPRFDTVGGIDLQVPELEIPGQFATIRRDNNAFLGIVGKDYEVVQNEEAFTFFDAIVGGGDGILYETAGALGQGERIFITAKLPGYIRVGSDDLIDKYIFLTTSHDGSGCIIAAFTPIRIVCNNTLNAALRNCSNVVKIRHTAGASDKLKDAHKVMGMADKLSHMMEDVFNQWSKIPVSDQQLQKLIRMAMSPGKEVLTKLEADKFEETSTVFKNTCARVFEYAMMSDTQQLDTTRGTLFGAYNAVTGFFQNVQDYKGDEEKMKSLIYGGTAQTKTQRAFDLCLDFAKADVNAPQFN
jgi:phage/plasmid-like protein (TIGR03299 family)